MRTLKELYFASPIYSWRLRAKPLLGFTARLSDDLPGNAAIARAILDGRMSYASGSFALSADPWINEPAEPDALEHLHGFSWLRDLRDLGGEAARLRARDLVNGWLARHDEWDALLWRPDILGERLSSWIGNYDFFGGSADDEFRARLCQSIGRQYRHLAGDIEASAPGIRRLLAAKGLFAAMAVIGENTGKFTEALHWLHRELGRQVFADGGHVSRSPAVQVTVLADLVEIRKALRLAEHDDAALGERISIMTSMLRLLRHGDGGLALFNHSTEGEVWFINSLIAQAEAKRKSSSSAPESGFERLVAGRTCLIMDTGKPSPAERSAHAGMLSFELSVGKQRMIVNCGASPADPKWDGALRATAAHSTLIIDDRNAAEIGADGVTGRRPEHVRAVRTKHDRDMLIEVEHDGYLPTHGLKHFRRVYLSHTGDDLTVEDRLLYTGDPGDVPKEACIRLHLHPKVRTSIIQSGSAALIRLGSGSGWRLRCDSALALNESVYFGKGGQFQRCEQLVIREPLTDIRASGEVTIRWSLHREDGKPKG